jgi:hypothetical protein
VTPLARLLAEASAVGVGRRHPQDRERCWPCGRAQDPCLAHSANWVPSKCRRPPPDGRRLDARVAELAGAVASLRITGDDLVPAEVTALLGAEPSTSFTRGEPQHLSQRPRKFGMWSLQSASTEPADVDAPIDEILTQLTTDMTVWTELAQRFKRRSVLRMVHEAGKRRRQPRTGKSRCARRRPHPLDLDLYAGDPGGE